MERIIEWVKQHPYLTGAVVVGLILLLYLRSASANAAQAAAPAASTYGGPSDAVQESEIAGSLALQQAGLAANTQVTGYNDQLSIAALQAAEQEQLAQFQSQDTIQQILSTQEVTDNQTGAQLALGIIQAGQTPLFTGTIGGLSFSGIATPGGNNSSGSGVTGSSSGPGVTSTPNTPAPAPTLINSALPNSPAPAAAPAIIAGGGGQPPSYEDLQASGFNPAAIPGTITGPGYTPPPSPNSGVSFTPSGWLTSCPSGYELINGACVSGASDYSVAVDLAQQQEAGNCSTYLGGVCPGPKNPYNNGPAGVPASPNLLPVTAAAAPGAGLTFNCQENPALCSPSSLYGA